MKINRSMKRVKLKYLHESKCLPVHEISSSRNLISHLWSLGETLIWLYLLQCISCGSRAF